MVEIPAWIESNEAMRAEIDRQLALAMFPYLLADEIEDAIDEELIVQGTGEPSKWPAVTMRA